MAEPDPRASRKSDVAGVEGLNAWLVRAMRKLGAGSTGRMLAGGAIGSFLLKGFSYLAAFLTTLLLTNTLGAEGYGAYAYGMNWMYLLLIPSLLGFDRLLLREVPVLEERGDWAGLRGLLRYAHRLVIGLSFAIALLAAVLAQVLTRLDDVSFAMTRATQLAMLVLPVFALLKLRQTILLAKKRYVTGLHGEMLFAVWGSLLIIVAVAVFAPERLTFDVAILSFLAATLAGVVYLVIRTRGVFSDELKRDEPRYAPRMWLVASLPMLLVAGMQMLNQRVDILMVGTLLGAEEVGVYSVANRGVLFVWLVFYGINLPLAPVLAELHSRNELVRLQNLLVRAARISTVVAVPVAALLIVFAVPFLSLFGKGFEAGREPLIIMAVAQVLAMIFGSASTALLMTGFERSAAVGIGISAVLNIGLNLLLIPRFGMNGAAWALAVGQVSAMGLMSLMVLRRLKINSTIFGRTM